MQIGNEERTVNSPAAVRSDIFSYDYTTVEAKGNSAPEIADCYEALGWDLASHRESFGGGATLNFKRNRKIKNKDQLSRLQIKLDDAIRSIGELEERKTRSANIVAIIVGIIGTLVFGGGMCMCMLMPETWALVVGIVLGAVGAGICALGYLAYKKLRAKNTTAMNVLIDKKRDEISAICEDAHRITAS